MLAASARFIGAAMLALIRDICSRSGSCSPTCEASSSFDRAAALFVSFAIFNLLLRGHMTSQFGLRPSAPLNDGAVRAGGTRRPAPVAGRDRGVRVGDDVDVAAAVTDELVYVLMDCLQLFCVIASATCEAAGFAVWLSGKER